MFLLSNEKQVQCLEGHAAAQGPVTDHRDHLDGAPRAAGRRLGDGAQARGAINGMEQRVPVRQSPEFPARRGQARATRRRISRGRRVETSRTVVKPAWCSMAVSSLLVRGRPLPMAHR